MLNRALRIGDRRRPFPGAAIGFAILAAMLLSLGLPATTSLTAGPSIQICVALDGSTSIASSDFDTMKNGLASAIDNGDVVPQNGAIELAVIQFYSLTGVTDVIVAPTVVDSPAAATAIANLVRATAKGLGGTPTDRAIDKCNQLITGSPNFAAATKQVINISTDGDPDNQAATISSRDSAVAAGIDEVDLEAIGPDPSTTKMLEIAYPGSGYLAPPFNGAGFVIKLATYADYANAIRQKLEQIIPRPSPTPTATGTITPTPTNSPTPTPTATPGPSPTSTSTPSATPTPAPAPTPIVQNGGFENDGGWTFSGFQRTDNSPNSGSWAVDSTPGQTGRVYQVVQVPADTVGIMLYFYWANVNPDISTSDTCLDYLQVKIMDPSLTQLYGSSNGYCSRSSSWNQKGLDFRYLIAAVRGKSVAIVFEVQPDSQLPNTVFFLDDLVLYFYDNITFLPVNFRDASNIFVAGTGASRTSVDLVPPVEDLHRFP